MDKKYSFFIICWPCILGKIGQTYAIGFQSLRIFMVSATTKQQQHYHISRHRRHYANHRYKTTVLWIEKLPNATKGP